MGRSTKKGPWVEERLMQRIARMNESGEKRMVKTWSRGALAIHVAFESGSVTGRSAEGIAAEANWSCATRPTSYSSSPAD